MNFCFPWFFFWELVGFCAHLAWFMCCRVNSHYFNPRIRPAIRELKPSPEISILLVNIFNTIHIDIDINFSYNIGRAEVVIICCIDINLTAVHLIRIIITVDIAITLLGYRNTLAIIAVKLPLFTSGETELLAAHSLRVNTIPVILKAPFGHSKKQGRHGDRAGSIGWICPCAHCPLGCGLVEPDKSAPLACPHYLVQSHDWLKDVVKITIWTVPSRKYKRNLWKKLLPSLRVKICNAFLLHKIHMIMLLITLNSLQVQATHVLVLISTL